ncbi:hypothetical protein ACFY2V_04750 [Streptomyces eurythermus]|uniref:hypothetical protein n=1 Tax=Streptomyces eurythermus TaxID=42237 RepID=UPI0036D168ED
MKVSVVRRGCAAAATLVIVALNGCGTDPGTERADENQRNARDFAAHIPTDRQLAVIRRGQSKLINSCMAEYGFRTHIEAPDYRPVYRDLRSEVRLPVTLDQAGKYGYRPGVRGTVRPASQVPGKAKGPDVTATERLKLTVLNGPEAAVDSHPVRVDGVVVPAGGCLRKSEKTLTEGAPDLGRRTNGRDAVNSMLWIRLQVNLQYMKDPQYLGMVDDWKRCLTRYGFPYQSFEAAENDARWNKGSSASEEEKRVALADVKCRIDVGFPTAANRLRTRYEKIFVEENPRTFDAIDRTYTVMVDNSEKVVNSGG